jgi:thiosulfate reductase cytochrome b subunit
MIISLLLIKSYSIFNANVNPGRCVNEKKIVISEKFTRVLRWSHWINFFMLTLMIWSGVLIYWANDQYIKIPNELASTLSIRGRLAEGMGWHFFIMWFFVGNGIVYISYLLLSSEWKSLAFDRKTLPEAISVIFHELKISKVKPIQKGKFNAAQKIAYVSAILMGAGAVVTGLAIYKPVSLGFLTSMLGGYKAARLEHFLIMIGFVLFFIVHIIQVTKAGWNNFRAMAVGYEIEKD